MQYSLSGKNIIGRSKNGTGKTGAYLIPILNKLDLSLSKPQALILSSSRELANQIADECKQIGKFMNVQVMSCIGGEAVSNDVLRLKQTVHVITATLGRITSLAEQGLCDLSQCKIVVLDEVDHLLGFNSFGNLERIMSFVPKTAQILAFSATFPESIKNDLVLPLFLVVILLYSLIYFIFYFYFPFPFLFLFLFHSFARCIDFHFLSPFKMLRTILFLALSSSQGFPSVIRSAMMTTTMKMMKTTTEH